MPNKQNKSKKRTRARRAIHALPFVSRGLWHVKPTGDYEADCITGEKYALAYLEYLVGLPSSGCGSLPSIVRAMPRDISGIEVGFLSMIDIAAGAGRHRAERVSAYWDDCRAKRVKPAV